MKTIFPKLNHRNPTMTIFAYLQPLEAITILNALNRSSRHFLAKMQADQPKQHKIRMLHNNTINVFDFNTKTRATKSPKQALKGEPYSLLNISKSGYIIFTVATQKDDTNTYCYCFNDNDSNQMYESMLNIGRKPFGYVAVNKMPYAICGFNEQYGPLSACESMINGKWEYINSCPKLLSTPTVCSLNKGIYVFDDLSNGILMYNVVTTNWCALSVKSSDSIEGRRASAIAISNNSIILFGQHEEDYRQGERIPSIILNTDHMKYKPYKKLCTTRRFKENMKSECFIEGDKIYLFCLMKLNFVQLGLDEFRANQI